MPEPDVEITFLAELLRPDDLLYLGVGGSNLRLQSDPEQGAYLEVENRNRRAYLQLTFQPQTIAESAFFEAAIVPGGTTPIGGEGDPRRESNPKQTPPQGATYHEPFANPGQPSSSAIAAAATQKPKPIRRRRRSVIRRDLFL